MFSIVSSFFFFLIIIFFYGEHYSLNSFIYTLYREYDNTLIARL